ncbi:MAG TPA: LysR substrate-binding domain-containing protein [Bacteroidia bacterium]|nr:LysR substrate-binding domain-containing protein [Bacteroidia bacterium]
MNIQQLEYIVALYQYGNFAKAAEKCFVTQPTLSMMIKRLEEELNVVIFDRNKNPIEPTDVGLQIIQKSQQILNEIEELKIFANQNKTSKKGNLKLGILPTIAPYLLPLILNSFSKKYADITLEINELTTDEIIEQLHKGLIDIGILATPLNDKDILEKKLFIEKFYIYTSDKKLLKSKKVSLKDIKNQTMWLLKEGHCFRNQVIEICHPQNKSSVQFIAGNLDTIIKLIDFHGGTTIIPELMIKYLSKSQFKKVVSFENPVPAREISIVQNKLFIKEHLINTLYDHIISVMKVELNQNTKTKIIRPL